MSSKQPVKKVTKSSPNKAVPSGTDAKSGFVPSDPTKKSTRRKGRRNA